MNKMTISQEALVAMVVNKDKARLLLPTYKRRAGHWAGAIKDGWGKIVWVCDHVHKNRDVGSWANGCSAMGCARTELHRREHDKTSVIAGERDG